MSPTPRILIKMPLETSPSFDPRVAALLREVGLRVLVTAAKVPALKRELLRESAWRDLFLDEPLYQAAVMLEHEASAERYVVLLARELETRSLAVRIEALAPCPQSWARDLAMLRSAQRLRAARQAAGALLQRREELLTCWRPDACESAALDDSLEAAAARIGAQHRVRGDWAATALLVEQQAVSARWLPSAGERDYYGSEGPTLRLSVLSDAVLRELDHPRLSEHPAVVRLVDAAAEWTADACWRKTGAIFVDSVPARGRATSLLRACPPELFGEGGPRVVRVECVRQAPGTAASEVQGSAAEPLGWHWRDALAWMLERLCGLQCVRVLHEGGGGILLESSRGRGAAGFVLVRFGDASGAQWQ